MEKVKKISTEDLERMQHHQNPTLFAGGESKEIVIPQNSNSTASTNNTT